MTQYRIKPVPNSLGHVYRTFLQFLSKRKVRKLCWSWKLFEVVEEECWRFVPSDSIIYDCNREICEESCHIDNDNDVENDHFGDLYNYVGLERSFLEHKKQFPDINVYFEHLKSKRQLWLKEEANSTLTRLI